MKNFITRSLTLGALALFAVGCGQPKVLTNLSVQTSTVDEDIYVDVKADLNLGNMTLPSVTFPILHPRGQTPIGSVELVSAIGGVNQMKINLNVSEIVDLHAAPALLPNGTTIPLIASNHVAVLNIGNGGKVYFLLSQSATAVAVAIPLSSFDRMGQSAPGINIFPVHSFNGIMATAGIFLSQTAGQNGIAIAADLSSVFTLPDSQPAPSLLAMQAQEEQVKLDYSSQAAPSKQKKKIDSMINDMNKKKTRLQL